MFEIIESLKAPWAWYVAGAVIGLIVPALLIIGNKTFGLSSNLRHICAACFPANIKFFKYNWKNELWNLFFVAGIMIGAFIATHYLSNPKIPPTTNGIEGFFSHLKNHLDLHRGLTLKHRIDFIKWYMFFSNER